MAKKQKKKHKAKKPIKLKLVRKPSKKVLAAVKDVPAPKAERLYEVPTDKLTRVHLNRAQALMHWRQVLSYCSYWVNEAKIHIRQLGG